MRERKSRYIRILASLLVFLMLLSVKAAAAENSETSGASQQESVQGNAAPPVEIAAKSAVLMDAATGKVMIRSNEHERLYPASVTKVMTLLLVAEALENGKIKLKDTVSTSAAAASKGGSQIWLKEGETMTVEELLKAAAIYSANDASCALAELVAGSEEGFVRMMNERAAALGLENSNFVNCTGLDDDTTEHLTSAYDIAVISRELLKHEIVIQYSTIWMDSLRGGETELVNTNRLVRFYEGATGLKTGTTSKAGCCISASARRGNTHLIAVVMGSGNSNDRFETAKRLLNWGFANYCTVTPHIAPAFIAPVRVLQGTQQWITPVVPEAISALVPKGSEEDLQQNVDLPVDVQAPVEAGQVLGTVTITLDGETLGEYPLTAPEAVPKLDFFTQLKRLAGALIS